MHKVKLILVSMSFSCDLVMQDNWLWSLKKRWTRNCPNEVLQRNGHNFQLDCQIFYYNMFSERVFRVLQHCNPGVPRLTSFATSSEPFKLGCWATEDFGVFLVFRFQLSFVQFEVILVFSILLRVSRSYLSILLFSVSIIQ